mmetsp:Transcript_6547/g.20947  ORF Transcript_6547/g.20947 Transcript_6547/m.20947 type:complete len:665 (+) Transcript_6547:195-2189(+)
MWPRSPPPRGAERYSPRAGAGSLPLGRGGRLGGDVERDARDARHLGQDAPLQLDEHLEREVAAGQRGLARHEVAGDEGADADRARSLHAEADREEHHRHLGERAEQVVLGQRLRDDVVRRAELVERVAREGRRRDGLWRRGDLLAQHVDDPVHVVQMARDLLRQREERLPLLVGRSVGRERGKVRVRAAVALDADRADGQQRRSEAQLGVAGALGSEGGRGAVVLLGEVRLGRAERADGEAGPGEGLPPDERRRQPELDPELAHLVLVVVLERLDDAPLVAQVADELRVVVVRLDDVRVGGNEGGGRLDQVGPQRALREVHILRLEPLLLDHRLGDPHERVADDLALELRRALGGERERGLAVDLGDRLCKVLGRVERVDRHAQRSERLHDARRLLVTHEAVVNVQRNQPLRPDGLVQESSTDGGVDAAGDEDEHLLVAHGGADLLDRRLLPRLHRVGAGQLGNLEEEVREDGVAVDRQVHLGVELDAVQTPLGTLDRSDDLARAADDAEAVGGLVDRVAVREQHLGRRAEPLEQRRPLLDLHVKDAIFALGAALDGAAAAVVHQLHAVADAEDREPHLEDLGVVLGRVVRVHGRAAARDDERGVAVPAQVLGGCVEGQQLALDLELAEAAVDHLAVLRAGVQDRHALGVGGGGRAHISPAMRV